MSLRVRCDQDACVAEADVVEGASWALLREVAPGVMAADVPAGWTSNHGLGGAWRHFCPVHLQPEIAGG